MGTAAKFGLLAIVTAVCGLGCGASAPPVAESEAATAALKTALDAWLAGESSEALANRTPPIHVSDTEWKSGKKLTKYEVKSGQSAGFGWRCDVILTVQAGTGPAKQHSASYRIDTEPAIVVVHEE